MPLKAFQYIVPLLFVVGGMFAQSDNTPTVRKYWVFFKDKGVSTSPSAKGLLSAFDSEYLSPRASLRRAKIIHGVSTFGPWDLPLWQPYLQAVKDIGGTLARESRWLNAASFYLTREERSNVERLSFVVGTRPVGTWKERKSEAGVPKTLSLGNVTSLDYGFSFQQVAMINVPPLHASGITGRGALIGMLDSGFRWRSHEALRTRHVVAEHDFVNGDDTTSNQGNDPVGEDSHGTSTFSVLGGFMPGKIIGPAFDADFILAKTEYVPTEYQGEEDNWAAALEWMERQGVDVVSSSVGYNVFDDGTGYSWQNGDFNGRTSVVARAALQAARLGVVVCTSMGNEGNGNGVEGTLLTPADADSIIAVGGVSLSRHLAYFSSTGPTNDGRIKPEVVAPGVNVYHATVPGPSTYDASDGNSFSTPLVAGAAALLLSVRPELTPLQVRDALKLTADTIDGETHPGIPNNFVGWGLVDAFDAVLSVGPVFSNKPVLTVSGGLNVVTTIVLSREGVLPDSVILYYAVGSDSSLAAVPMVIDSSMFFPSSGRYRTTLPLQPSGSLVRFFIGVRDSAGNTYSTPSPITGARWHLHYGDTTVEVTPPHPTHYALMQNYPNPFNVSTVIEYEVSRGDRVVLSVYNLLGERVTTIVDEVQGGEGMWSKRSVIFSVQDLPTGVYFYRLTTPSWSATKKMLLIR